ncbi:hypothetical protein AK812_SmicGene23768 [Symbiodinium microadriaticum]|uniref:Uncharacterized protein n=1 Tax=Symbiodinium microadriaticum TaxID=2951 RepID=A0A1Q9DGC8_SYMMI|nr:hypothetical protein AK812_SmicGene23768 [Symbiodinium microadriaticum]
MPSPMWLLRTGLAILLLPLASAVGSLGACHNLVASVAEMDDMYLAALCRARLGHDCDKLLAALGPRPWGLQDQVSACEQNKEILDDRHLFGSTTSAPLDETTQPKKSKQQMVLEALEEGNPGQDSAGDDAPAPAAPASPVAPSAARIIGPALRPEPPGVDIVTNVNSDTHYDPETGAWKVTGKAASTAAPAEMEAATTLPPVSWPMYSQIPSRASPTLAPAPPMPHIPDVVGGLVGAALHHLGHIKIPPPEQKGGSEADLSHFVAANAAGPAASPVGSAEPSSSSDSEPAASPSVGSSSEAASSESSKAEEPATESTPAQGSSSSSSSESEQPAASSSESSEAEEPPSQAASAEGGGMAALVGAGETTDQEQAWSHMSADGEKKFLTQKVSVGSDSHNWLIWSFVGIAVVSSLSSLALRTRLLEVTDPQDPSDYSRLQVPALSSRELHLASEYS